MVRAHRNAVLCDTLGRTRTASKRQREASWEMAC